jgi:hypothetical protein
MAAGGKITTLAACTASNITSAPKSGLPVPYNVKVQAKGKSLDAPRLEHASLRQMSQHVYQRLAWYMNQATKRMVQLENQENGAGN